MKTMNLMNFSLHNDYKLISCVNLYNRSNVTPTNYFKLFLQTVMWPSLIGFVRDRKSAYQKKSAFKGTSLFW